MPVSRICRLEGTAHRFAASAEEAPGAYKDVSEVVDAADDAHLAQNVVRLEPRLHQGIERPHRCRENLSFLRAQRTLI